MQDNYDTHKLQCLTASNAFINKRHDDAIRYDSGYLTCSKKLTGSQLSLPHGINRKLKCETKNKMMSVISKSSPVPLS